MRWVEAGAVLVTALLLAGCGGSPDPAPPPSGEARAVVGQACPALGQQSTAAAALPDVELPCLGGEGAAPLPVRRLTGTPTVLNLWATWCAPCRDELPALARLQQAGAGKVRVLGVVTRDSAGAALSYAADERLPFPSLADRDGKLLVALRQPGLPATVFLGADGAIAEVYRGPPLTDETLRALVRDELGVDVG